MSHHPYCTDLFRYQRRRTREVRVGEVGLGGDNPIRVQSMLTSDTLDTEACVTEALGLAEAGCEIVRITAPARRHAANLQNIVDALRAEGCSVPVVADIHFKPDAALEAANWVDKVRVNPGNYADSKKFAVLEYTDEEYQAELERIEKKFTPLVLKCKERGVAIRIGTNHGSLSDRILNRYGDTPHGMVESALEFARIARQHDFHDFVFSMKASNPKVMVEAYRLLVATLEAQGPDWNYPLHLGVTEAGDGEDGRIKSAIGIGSLLADGLGDTLRVSLTEDAIYEIPVARKLVAWVQSYGQRAQTPLEADYPVDPFRFEKRASEAVEVEGLRVGGGAQIGVFTDQRRWDAVAHKLDRMGDFKPEGILESHEVLAIDPMEEEAVAAINESRQPRLITVADGTDLAILPAFRLLASRVHPRHPILLKDTLSPEPSSQDFVTSLLHASVNVGSLLCDGVGDAVVVRGEEAPGQSLRIAYNILQAAGARIFKTDYVACPSCGRTLFNLQSTTQKIREATGHLKGVRIAVMGCIVNGPGEMADADFGYVGGAPGKINLYVGKEAVKFNIPEEEAVDRLKDLISEHGKWMDPPVPQEASVN
ncbi:MAG: (E)-4-hydroxy-3-methylbut-2-enyl-diphosphate synthase [Verrucomicrobiota bacterium]